MLVPMHGRISASRPARALATRYGSATIARTIDTMSATPVSTRWLAWSRVMIRPVTMVGTLDGAGDLLAAGQLVAERVVHRRQELVEPPVRAHRQVEEVDQRFDVPGDGDRLGRIDPALDEVRAGQAHADGEVGADRGADRFEDLDEEAAAVLQRAAVVVVAQVRRRREILTDQIAVRTVQFDAVEATVTAAHRGGSERGDGVVDHRLRHRAGHEVDRRGRHRRGRHRLPGPPVRRAAVPQLLEHLGAVGVHPPGELGVERRRPGR